MNSWDEGNLKYYMLITLKVLGVITDYLNIVDQSTYYIVEPE